MSDKKFENAKCLMFDLDNTLIVRVPTVERVAKKMCSLWFENEPENHEKIIDAFARAFVSGYVSVHHMWDMFSHEIDVHGRTWDEFQKLWYFYFSFLTVVEPSIGAIEELKRMGYKVVILTNGLEIEQNAKVDSAGLREMFDEVYVSESLGIHKPDPGVFLLCAEKLGLKPEEVIYVGDHWQNDIRGGRSAGMRTIWMGAYMEFPDDVKPADAEIKSLWELTELMPDLTK